MTSTTDDVSGTDIEYEALVDDVEEAVVRLVTHQLDMLKEARQAFEQEKQMYEEQKSKVVEIMNLKKVSSV